jgi:methyl-accepting chemotaxis protein
MTITKRLLFTLFIALGALLLVGAYGIRELQLAQSRFDYVQTNTLPSLKVMADAQRALTSIRVSSLKLIVAPNDTLRKEAKDGIARADTGFAAAMADYEAHDLSNDIDRQLLAADRSSMDAYRAVRDRSLQMFQAGDRDGSVKLLLIDGKAAADAIYTALEKHYQFNTQQAETLSRDSARQYEQSLILLCVIIGAAFLGSGLLAAHLYRIIRGGLAGIQDTLVRVDQSLDFTLRAPVARMDEIGHTATAFNSLLDRLQLSLKSLFDGATEVADASQQLSQTASQVSTASSAQSAAAATMAATVEQMTVSINHVADQARLTHNGTAETGKLVEEGSGIIGQTIKDIHEISAVVKTSAASILELEVESGQVSAVINVIRDIADQTNLLALNAAIEAARAGEQGRGFAVVADEVRKLAERTARSTQEISVTIESMVARAQQATGQMKSAEQLVETGVARADDADGAIRRIGENSGAATRSISEISTAIQQQGAASNSIAAQVEHTAQMSEESSAAAQLTADSALRLDRLAQSQIATLSQYTV